MSIEISKEIKRNPDSYNAYRDFLFAAKEKDDEGICKRLLQLGGVEEVQASIHRQSHHGRWRYVRDMRRKSWLHCSSQGAADTDEHHRPKHHAVLWQPAIRLQALPWWGGRTPHPTEGKLLWIRCRGTADRQKKIWITPPIFIFKSLPWRPRSGLPFQRACVCVGGVV